MNQTVLTGNLTRDPESRVLNNGGKSTTVTNFTVASSRKFKKRDGSLGEEVTYVDAEAWDSGAESIAKYFSKGSPILVIGQLKNDSWEKDGVKHTKLKLRVERFEFFSQRKDRPVTDETPVEAGVTSGESDSDGTPQDIPF